MCEGEGVKESVRKVSSMDIEQYLESVNKKYTEGKTMFETHILNLQAAPLTVAMTPTPPTPTQPATSHP